MGSYSGDYELRKRAPRDSGQDATPSPTDIDSDLRITIAGQPSQTDELEHQSAPSLDSDGEEFKADPAEEEEDDEELFEPVSKRRRATSTGSSSKRKSRRKGAVTTKPNPAAPKKGRPEAELAGSAQPPSASFSAPWPALQDRPPSQVQRPTPHLAHMISRLPSLLTGMRLEATAGEYLSSSHRWSNILTGRSGLHGRCQPSIGVSVGD